jgi:hypothetical protein
MEVRFEIFNNYWSFVKETTQTYIFKLVERKPHAHSITLNFHGRSHDDTVATRWIFISFHFCPHNLKLGSEQWRQ